MIKCQCAPVCAHVSYVHVSCVHDTACLCDSCFGDNMWGIVCLNVLQRELRGRVE